MMTIISEHERELTVSVPVDVVAKEYNSALRIFKQTKSRPGYRPGKMPEAMVKQFFGAEIKRHVVENLIKQSFKPACQANDVTPVSEEKLEFLDEVNPNKEFVYKAVFQAKPIVEIKKYENLEFELKNYIFGPEDINQELEYIREGQALFVAPTNRDYIGNNDLVECDSDIVIDGEINFDYSHKDYSVPLFAPNVPDDLRSALVGKKVGEQTSIMYTMPDDHQDELIKGKVCEMILRIKAFKERVLPELNDDFAKDLSDRFSTLEEVKESIELRLRITANRRRDYSNKATIVKQLIENNPVEVPPAMVNRATIALLNYQFEKMEKKEAEEIFKNHGQELWDAANPQALFKVKEDLILEALIAKLNIEASDEEISYRVENSKDLSEEDARWSIQVEKVLDQVKKLGHIKIIEEELFPKSTEECLSTN